LADSRLGAGDAVEVAHGGTGDQFLAAMPTAQEP
jgi:hypothetical protein